MEATADRQRGLELGRRWAEHASKHELATMVSGSFDDLSQILPPDMSDQFVGRWRLSRGRVARLARSLASATAEQRVWVGPRPPIVRSRRLAGIASLTPDGHHY